MGLQGFGDAYDQAIEEGKSENEALAYGVLTGVTNVAMQKLLGGINVFGKSIISKTAGKQLNQLASRLSKNPTVQKAFAQAGNMASEGTEEYIQAVLDPVFRNITFDENNAIDPLSMDKIEQGLLGMATSGVLNAGTSAARRTRAGISRRSYTPAQQQKVIQEYPNATDGGVVENNLGTEPSHFTPKQVQDFLEQVAETMLGERRSDKPLFLGDTPEVLKRYGAKPHKLTLSQSSVRKIAYPKGYMGGNHNLGFGALAQLPQQLENPVAILRSATQPNSLVIFTELLDSKNRPVMVALHLDKDGVIGLTNEIASMYGRKGFAEFIDQEKKAGRLLYERTERALAELPATGKSLTDLAVDADPMLRMTKKEAEQQPPVNGLQLPEMATEVNLNSSIQYGEDSVKSLLDISAAKDKIHTPEQQKVIQEYQGATDEELVKFAKVVQTFPDQRAASKMEYTLPPVAPKLAADIKEATGIDASGFQNSIKGNAVEHILKRHGENGQHDHSMANLADLGRIQYVLEHYDTLERLYGKDGQPNLSREFKNTDGNPAQLILLKSRTGQRSEKAASGFRLHSKKKRRRWAST